MALNPRMRLFSRSSAYDLVVESGNTAALAMFETRLATSEWGLYRVERVYEQNIGKSGKPYVRADRRVVCLRKGSREEVTAELKQKANVEQPVEHSYCASRVYSHRRVDGAYPAVEGFWVICPALVEDKVRNTRSFAQKWAEFSGETRQLSLI